MDAVYAAETSVATYQTARGHNPEDCEVSRLLTAGITCYSLSRAQWREMGRRYQSLGLCSGCWGVCPRNVSQCASSSEIVVFLNARELTARATCRSVLARTVPEGKGEQRRAGPTV
jgi:hypothetical protein